MFEASTSTYRGCQLPAIVGFRKGQTPALQKRLMFVFIYAMMLTLRKGNPAARQTRKAYGPPEWETAGLPNGEVLHTESNIPAP